MKTEKDVIKEIAAKSLEDTPQGAAIRKFMKVAEPLEGMLPEDAIVVVARAGKKDDPVDSSISKCSGCNHDVLVSPSTISVLPVNRKVDFTCEVCLLDLIKKEK